MNDVGYGCSDAFTREQSTAMAGTGQAAALFDHELFAMLLDRESGNPGLAKLCDQVFELYAGRALSPLTAEEIRAGCGLTAAEATRLSAAVELARRLLWPEDGSVPIRSPRDACRTLGPIRAAAKEHFIALYLNARNLVIAQETISIGSLNANIVHPREVFRPAIINAAATVILAHNHPSGDVTPSQEDLNLTARMVEGGRMLGIDILDHLIVTESRFLSLRSESYL